MENKLMPKQHYVTLKKRGKVIDYVGIDHLSECELFGNADYSSWKTTK